MAKKGSNYSRFHKVYPFKTIKHRYLLIKRYFLQILDVEYSASMCYYDCSQQVTLEKCSCLLPIDGKYLKNSNDVSKICRMQQMRDCALEDFGKSAFFGQCSARCLQRCDIDKIDLTLSSIAFPSAILTNPFWHNLGYEVLPEESNGRQRRRRRRDDGQGVHGNSWTGNDTNSSTLELDPINTGIISVIPAKDLQVVPLLSRGNFRIA